MKVTFFGTGTSFGIPVINCRCECCRSKNPHDRRFRSSVKVEANDGTTVVVDTGPEFRLQALKYGLKKLDALLITHSHADHVHGLDDVRIFAHVFSDPKKNSPPLDIYANKNTNDDLKVRFDYVFKSTQFGGGKPSLNLIDCESYSEKNPIKIGPFSIIPVPMVHGKLATSGWIFKEEGCKDSFAYLTDCSYIPDSSIELVKNCNYLVLDALRDKEHPTHLSFSQAFQYLKRMNGKNFYFIHMCHDTTERKMFKIFKNLKREFELEKDVMVMPSYDGQIIRIN
ncbi:MAG: MBL fold metallo-hydrolase [Treponemataceae bacterium]|nr:MBL fold metallo-hydrolase [Treponemataceae bacterium]